MSWVLRLSMGLNCDFDVLGPGLAYIPDGCCLYIDVPECMDSYQTDKGRPVGRGSVPYPLSDVVAIMLGAIDGLKDMRRPVKRLAIQMERHNPEAHRKGRE